MDPRMMPPRSRGLWFVLAVALPTLTLSAAGAAPPTQTVLVTNATAQPVPVSVQGAISVAPAALIPYQQFFEIDFPNCSSSPNGCYADFGLPAVLANQRLTITYVSCRWPFVGTIHGLQLKVATYGGGNSGSEMTVPAPYETATAISAQATFYVNAGEVANAEVEGGNELSGSRVYCNISGYLTQIPPG